jgi:heme o synthase
MSMTSAPLPLETPVAFSWSTFASDVVELTKPRISVMALVAVAVSGTVARWGQPDIVLVFHAVIGIALVAASASASNQLVERELDASMPRTSRRPLPSGRLSVGFVVGFALATGFAGLAHLLAFTDPITALLGAATWVLYVVVYTPLKTKTSLNTAVGAVGGAMPVVLGWHAVGGAWDARLLALFSLLFLWQFPHFMAIAWLYRSDYSRAGMKMLTVVDPSGQRAGVQAVIAAAALIPVSLFPILSVPGFGSVIYLLVAVLLGSGQLALSVSFFRNRDEKTARRLLRASLIYLPAILLLLVLHPWL